MERKSQFFIFKLSCSRFSHLLISERCRQRLRTFYPGFLLVKPQAPAQPCPAFGHFTCRYSRTVKKYSPWNFGFKSHCMIFSTSENVGDNFETLRQRHDRNCRARQITRLRIIFPIGHLRIKSNLGLELISKIFLFMDL